MKKILEKKEKGMAQKNITKITLFISIYAVIACVNYLLRFAVGKTRTNFPLNSD